MNRVSFPSFLLGQRHKSKMSLKRYFVCISFSFFFCIPTTHAAFRDDRKVGNSIFLWGKSASACSFKVKFSIQDFLTQQLSVVNVTGDSDLWQQKHSFPSHSSSSSSYHRLRAGPFPGEEVPEVGGRWRFALLLRRLSHPDAALRRPAQTGAAAAADAAADPQGEAQRGAQRAPAVLGVVVLTVVSGGGGRGGLGQAEQVVVGVELTHVADGFTWRGLTWRSENKQEKRRFEPRANLL